MEEDTITIQKDLFYNDLEALPKKPEEPVAKPSTSSEWPLLLASQGINKTLLPVSYIPPRQKPLASPAIPVSQATKKKSSEDHERDRVKKYALYFQGTNILSILELVVAIEPKTLSFIITDLKTRRLARIKKETFKELLKSAGILCWYFC